MTGGVTYALIDNAFLGILGAAIPASAVVVLAATGALLGERVGVLNLGQEGLIALGAVATVLAVLDGGISSPWLAFLIGVTAGLGAGLVFAAAAVVARANQVLVGLALALGGVGLANQLGTNRTGSPIVPTFRPLDPGGLFTSNEVFEALFHHDPIVYLAYVLLPAVIWFVYYRTRLGLSVRAVGENPGAADAAGASVLRLRFMFTALGCAVSSAAGAYMVLTITPTWSPDIARGRGWVALAVVILARWRPFPVVAGALLYGSMISLDATTQARGWRLPFMSSADLSFLLSMLPYLVTLVAILVPAAMAHRKRQPSLAAAPAALTVPYFREER